VLEALQHRRAVKNKPFAGASGFVSPVCLRSRSMRGIMLRSSLRTMLCIVERHRAPALRMASRVRTF